MTQREVDAEKDRVLKAELMAKDAAECEVWANRMGYHKANETTVPLHRELRKAYIDMAEYLVTRVPEGRERALALTSLQESLMWANAGVAINLAVIALDD